MTFGARYSTPCISRRRLDAAACSQPRQQPCGEGDALYAQLLERFPSDVWLRNSAALTYLDIADWATALWWIDTALELTMNDGDQVRLIDQLVDMRSRALAALGRSGDDNLGRRVAAFVPSPRSWSAGVADSWSEVEPSTERCEHCGGQSDHVGWIPTDGNDDLWAVQSLNESNFPAVSAKMPRNSPCPCGSGLKAKKCCHRQRLTSGSIFPRLENLWPQVRYLGFRRRVGDPAFDACCRLPIVPPGLDGRDRLSKEDIMKGYIRQRGDRYYAVIYEGRDPVTGKERRTWHPAGTDRSDAERLAAKLAASETSKIGAIRAC